MMLKQQKNKAIPPQQLVVWVAVASISMMFAGLTSAFIVKSNLTGWRTIVLPKIFWVSTIVVVASSIALQMAISAFRAREMRRYRVLWMVTALLGIAFIILQIVGFTQLWANNIRFRGSSGAGQFFYAIVGLHALHVIGGVIALVVMWVRALTGRTKSYQVAPLKVMATYWHYVGGLWLFLMIFFLIVG